MRLEIDIKCSKKMVYLSCLTLCHITILYNVFFVKERHVVLHGITYRIRPRYENIKRRI